jgi:hypothetical protein
MSAPGIKLESSIVTTAGFAAYGGGTSAYFFRAYGPLHPDGAYERIQPGWTVTGNPTWIVTSVVPDSNDNNESCTITISGGSFIDTTYYSFTGPTGMTIQGGVTITV